MRGDGIIFMYRTYDLYPMASKVSLTSEPKYEKVLETIAGIRKDAASKKDTLSKKDIEFRIGKLFVSYVRPSVDSVVLSRILSLCHVYSPTRFQELLNKIASDVRSYRPNVVLIAAEYALDDGDLNLARTMVSEIGEVENPCLHSYVSGRIIQLSGDVSNARARYMDAIRYDPYFPKVYDALNSIEPEFGWTSIRDLMMLKEDTQKRILADVPGPMGELLLIYSNWLEGKDRANAMKAITSSSHFLSGDPFYKIVYAWMCVSDGRYRKAVRAYAEAIGELDGNVAFLSEMADIQDRMGQSEDSVVACQRALAIDKNSDKATAQLAISLVHMGRVHDAMSTIDTLVSLPVVDATLCGRCIEVLWDEDRKSDANSLYRKIHGRCSDRVYSMYLDSMCSNRNGDHRAARRFAESGKKIEPDDARCICQHARALAGLGKVDDAIKEIDSKIPALMDISLLMEARKDILMNARRYGEAIECCNKILSENPRNADIMSDKANAYRLSGDYREAVSWYRESLNIHEDLRLFQSVLKMLLESRRIDDLCRLVDDYDDTYGMSAMVWRIRGNAEYLDRRYEDAVLSYAKASAIVSNDIDIWYSKGMAEEKAGMYSDAEASYDRAAILDLDNSECWISKATVQELQGNIVGAIDSINRAISASSEDVFALVTKGRLLAKVGKLKEAEFFLDLAYKIDSSNPKILEMILRVLVRAGNIKRASRIGKIVLERDPNNILVMFIMSEVYAAENNKEKAVKMLHDARPFIGSDPGLALRCAELYHRLMCYSEEIDIYRSLVVGHPDSRDYMMRLAEAYSASGNRDAASEIYRKLESMVPDDPSISVKKVLMSAEGGNEPDTEDDTESLFAFAKELVDGGKPTDAIPVFEKILGSCPNDPEKYLYAAEIMFRNGSQDRALEVMKQARGAFPADARVMLMLGTLRSRKGDNPGALSAYSDAARLGMVSHDLFAEMGRTQLQMGILAPAVESLSSAVETDPSDTDVRMDLCRALFRAGRQEEALPHLRVIIDKHPDCTEALRMYVTAVSVNGGSEAVLSMFDRISAAPRTDDDTAFFIQALERIGEYTRAESLRPQVPEQGVFDLAKTALDAMDLAYVDGYELSDMTLYERLGLSESQTEAVLDLISAPSDYVPKYGSEEFDRMESLSNTVIVSEGCSDIEDVRNVSLQAIRHATQLDSVELILSLHRHIELSFAIEGVPEECAEKVGAIAAELPDGTQVTMFDLMSQHGIGTMTARMVMNSPSS